MQISTFFLQISRSFKLGKCVFIKSQMEKKKSKLWRNQFWILSIQSRTVMKGKSRISLRCTGVDNLTGPVVGANCTNRQGEKTEQKSNFTLLSKLFLRNRLVNYRWQVKWSRSKTASAVPSVGRKHTSLAPAERAPPAHCCWLVASVPN